MKLNLRVSAALHQGDRRYMEDQYSIHYECDKETGKFLYAYFGIFDGHGGSEASKYAKANLHKNIVGCNRFWSENPHDVRQAIKEGFLQTHSDMWKEIGQWPRTATGMPSTAGTTASVAIIKGDKLYTGHVGDSGIALGLQKCGSGTAPWTAERLTWDHKPDCPMEKSRIMKMGGKVVPKAGVPRVVWKRPRDLGPVRREEDVDHIPFLAVARSLGDLWSYNFDNDTYAISPEPDIDCRDFDPDTMRCLVLASDGLWNLASHEAAVKIIEMTDRKWFREALYEKKHPTVGNPYYHPASTLVHLVLRKWHARNLRADNTSAVVVMIDPVGEAVPDALEQLQQNRDLIYKDRNEFCASEFAQREEIKKSNISSFILDMTGARQKTFYQDNDRFELYFGKPNVRLGVPHSSDEPANTRIQLYDVIIHKVITPTKKAPGLGLSRSTGDLWRPQETATRRGLTSGMRLFSPNTNLKPPTTPSRVFADVSKEQGVETHFAETTSSSPVKFTLGEPESPPEVPSPSLSSPDIITDEVITPPITRGHDNVIKKLRGVACSIVALNAKNCVRQGRRSLRKTGGRIAVSPLKKRNATTLDLTGSKKRRLSAPVLLTKVSAHPTPVGVKLRPRHK